jgi:DNA methylase
MSSGSMPSSRSGEYCCSAARRSISRSDPLGLVPQGPLAGCQSGDDVESFSGLAEAAGCDAAKPTRVYWNASGVTLYHDDAREVLSGLPAGSVDCVVTSPPYWGLRDYRVAGQYGTEPTVDGYVESLVRVFDEVARVLTPEGTVWLNLADTFGGSWGNYVAPGSTATTVARRKRWLQRSHRPPQARSRPKDLQGVPWRVAFALVEQGWCLRDAIVWANPTPARRAFAIARASATRCCSSWHAARTTGGHRSASPFQVRVECGRFPRPAHVGVTWRPVRSRSPSGISGWAAVRVELCSIRSPAAAPPESQRVRMGGRSSVSISTRTATPSLGNVSTSWTGVRHDQRPSQSDDAVNCNGVDDVCGDRRVASGSGSAHSRTSTGDRSDYRLCVGAGRRVSVSGGASGRCLQGSHDRVNPPARPAGRGHVGQRESTRVSR